MTSSPTIPNTQTSKSYEISIYLNKNLKNRLNKTLKTYYPDKIIAEDTVFIVNGTFTEINRKLTSYRDITYDVTEQQTNGLPADFKPFEILPYSDLLDSDALFLIYTEFFNNVIVDRIYGRCYLNNPKYSFTLEKLLSLEATKLKTSNATISSFNYINNDNKMFDSNLSNILNDYVSPDYEPLKLFVNKEELPNYYENLYSSNPDKYNRVMDQQRIKEENMTPEEESAAQELKDKLIEQNRIKYSEIMSDFWNIYTIKKSDYKLVAFNSTLDFQGKTVLSSFNFYQMFKDTRLYYYIIYFNINDIH
jgi:hypothetical protein